MKKIFAITVLAGLFLLPAYIAQAALYDSLTVRVKVTPALSVTIDEESLTLDNVTAGGTTASATGVTVKNDGSGVKETYSLSLTNPGDIDPAKQWKASETNPLSAGVETFILNAAFATAKDKVTWDDTKHALSKNPVPCDDTRFAGDQKGKDVPYNEPRKLWFQFKAPTATSVSTEQGIVVTVTAQAS